MKDKIPETQGNFGIVEFCFGMGTCVMSFHRKAEYGRKEERKEERPTFMFKD